MKSKRSLEGYLIVDNRHAPGFSDEEAARLGKPGAIGGRGVVEAAVLTCSHCHRQMIVQPLRTRERPYCRRCDHYICDDCALVAKLNGGACRPMTHHLDQLQEEAGRALNIRTL